MKNILWTVFSGVIALTDLFFKRKSEESAEKEDREILGGRIIVRNVHNHGLALNTLDEYPKVVKAVSLTALAIVALFQCFTSNSKENLLQKAGLTFILGGAVSNVYDRLKRGYVVDYIAFNIKNKKAKAVTYNLGDFAIFGGTFLLIGNLLKK